MRDYEFQSGNQFCSVETIVDIVGGQIAMAQCCENRG